MSQTLNQLGQPTGSTSAAGSSFLIRKLSFVFQLGEGDFGGSGFNTATVSAGGVIASGTLNQLGQPAGGSPAVILRAVVSLQRQAAPGMNTMTA